MEQACVCACTCVPKNNSEAVMFYHHLTKAPGTGEPHSREVVCAFEVKVLTVDVTVKYTRSSKGNLRSLYKGCVC